MPPRHLAAALLLFGLSVAAQQQVSQSGAEDKAVLLALKAAADTSDCAGMRRWNSQAAYSPVPDFPGFWSERDSHGQLFACPLDSWSPVTDPCGDGWDDWSWGGLTDLGWFRVLCDRRNGRVVYLTLDTPAEQINLKGELLPYFGRLGALQFLGASGNPGLSGDVADLAGATELRFLGLAACPLVRGNVAALAVLVHLGEEYTYPCGGDTVVVQPGHWSMNGTVSFPGRVSLVQTAVRGPVAALRALPGIVDDLGPRCDEYQPWNCSDRVAEGGCTHGECDHAYTPCSAFGGRQHRGFVMDWCGDHDYHPGGRDELYGQHGGWCWPTNSSPGCEALGLAPVANAESVAGNNACVCCVDSACPADVDCIAHLENCIAVCRATADNPDRECTLDFEQYDAPHAVRACVLRAGLDPERCRFPEPPAPDKASGVRRTLAHGGGGAIAWAVAAALAAHTWG
eukprot:COSAG04_NODE_262_length_18654_cov_17.483751_4_plen_456_part_00